MSIGWSGVIFIEKSQFKACLDHGFGTTHTLNKKKTFFLKLNFTIVIKTKFEWFNKMFTLKNMHTISPVSGVSCSIFYFL